MPHPPEPKTPPRPAPQKWFIYKTALVRFGPRLFVTCLGWVANDFAFYGNKLFQSSFIGSLPRGSRSGREVEPGGLGHFPS